MLHGEHIDAEEAESYVPEANCTVVHACAQNIFNTMLSQPTGSRMNTLENQVGQFKVRYMVSKQFAHK